MTLEHKQLALQVKIADDAGTIEGAGAVADNVDLGNDLIEEKALHFAIERRKQEGRMPKMLWQHDTSKIIGVWNEMEVRGKDLHMKGKLLLDLPLAQQAHILVKAGALDGLSIGYRTLDYDREKGVRRLKDIDILEASLVTFPMNPKARLRDVKHLEGTSEVEDILREAGVPKRFAKLVAAHGFDKAKTILDDKGRDASGLEAEQVIELRDALKKLKETFNA